MPDVKFLATADLGGVTIRAGTCLRLTDEQIATLPSGTVEPYPAPPPPEPPAAEEE